MKFTASVAGPVTGVRFYKQTWMNGYLHVGHLWSSTGALLATATFTNESAYGWQQVSFASPVTIQANTVYVSRSPRAGAISGSPPAFSRPAGSRAGLCRPCPTASPVAMESIIAPAISPTSTATG